MPNLDGTLTASELSEYLKRERREAKADPIAYGRKQAETVRRLERLPEGARLSPMATQLGRLLGLSKGVKR